MVRERTCGRQHRLTSDFQPLASISWGGLEAPEFFERDVTENAVRSGCDALGRRGRIADGAELARAPRREGATGQDFGSTRKCSFQDDALLLLVRIGQRYGRKQGF